MRERKKIPLEVVMLEEGTIHLLVLSVLNGDEKHWWVVDSGASKSVIDKALAASCVADESEGLMATGLGKEMVETSSGYLHNLRLGDLCFDPLQVAVVDLHHINEEYSKYSDKRIAGLLGSDFFFREKAIIDYSDQTISF